MTVPSALRSGRRLWRWGPFSLLWRPRALFVGLMMLGLIALLAVILLGTGTITLSPGQILQGLTGTSDEASINRVVQRIRLPRILTAALVGAALGMAGAVFQSLSRNILGSPDVIGFTTGAATGAIAQILLFDAGAFQTAAAAMGSGIVTALVVLALSRGQGGNVGGYRLILVGIGIGAVLSGVNTLLLVKSDLDRAMMAQIWLAGSLTARSWSHVWPVLVGLCLFAPVILVLSRRLAILELGEDMAIQLGLRIGRLRLMLVLAAVGLTSVATASTGPIAFIALAGPQLARRVTRSPDVPLLTGALAGAVLLLAADLLSLHAPFGLAMPIGLTTGLLGGLYLLTILTQPARN